MRSHLSGLSWQTRKGVRVTVWSWSDVDTFCDPVTVDVAIGGRRIVYHYYLTPKYWEYDLIVHTCDSKYECRDVDKGVHRCYRGLISFRYNKSSSEDLEISNMSLISRGLGATAANDAHCDRPFVAVQVTAKPLYICKSIGMGRTNYASRNRNDSWRRWTRLPDDVNILLNKCSFVK